MEFKALKEYKNPECPTVEENKNRILMMMVRSGKISLGVAVMCVLCNYSWASDSYSRYFDGGFPTTIEPEPLELSPLENGMYGVIRAVALLGILIDLIVTIVLGVKNHKKYKICEDVEEKEKLRKIKNKGVIIGVSILILLILSIIICNIIVEGNYDPYML